MGVKIKDVSTLPKFDHIHVQVSRDLVQVLLLTFAAVQATTAPDQLEATSKGYSEATGFACKFVPEMISA